jgi:myo-inositol-1(or 4)-monophosphatase
MNYLTVCEQARAGGEILQAWAGKFTVREKGPADLVTEADLASQEAVRQVVLGAFPQHVFLGEETPCDARPEGEFCWVVDPLDGTTNYVHGVPEYCVSVALERQGQLLAAAVFNPVCDDCFTAAAGGGARLNGRPIQTSDCREMSKAVVAASFPPGVRRDAAEVQQFLAVLTAAQSVRRTGSAALNLCYVAAGRFDAYWTTCTKPWDVAAGLLILQEAGGVTTDLTGQSIDLFNPKIVVAATAELAAEIRRLVASEQ